ncbi:hypothetical protein [Glaciihabitans sp. dw_435]|uniref:hypothetical protein n=1 Tax=Glaciihabitans sp. dw_435 TaxID=2720081 RepID=UPI001BD5067B|nr:hypothetical protein [Glaciihabitans sp. dw_435]
MASEPSDAAYKRAGQLIAVFSVRFAYEDADAAAEVAGKLAAIQLKDSAATTGSNVAERRELQSHDGASES